MSIDDVTLRRKKATMYNGFTLSGKKKYKYIQGPVRRRAKSMRKAARYYGI